MHKRPEISARGASRFKKLKQPQSGHGEMMEKKFVFLLLCVCLITVASASAQTTIRVNAGGSNYTDSSGHLWSADHGFNTGNLSSCATKATVTGTTSPTLYKSARYDTSASPELQYTFAVTNGTYTVNLYFAETCSGYTAGKRVFDVRLQGVTTFSSLDIAKAVGINHALVKSATVSATAGKLTIGFVHHADSPEITAIEILPGATVAPRITTQPVSKTLASSQKATFTVSSTGTAPLSYQWQKNSISISGATASTYITPTLSTSDNGAGYKVIVSNSKGSVTSSTAWLTVTSTSGGGTSGGTTTTAPTITSHPASAVISAGETH
ncbi:MAG TPA: malectin domain-containing carbohydrate-binding protein, partial [Candidatus Acidoferrum sp.]